MWTLFYVVDVFLTMNLKQTKNYADYANCSKKESVLPEIFDNIVYLKLPVIYTVGQ